MILNSFTLEMTTKIHHLKKKFSVKNENVKDVLKRRPKNVLILTSTGSSTEQHFPA